MRIFLDVCLLARDSEICWRRLMVWCLWCSKMCHLWAEISSVNTRYDTM